MTNSPFRNRTIDKEREKASLKNATLPIISNGVCVSPSCFSTIPKTKLLCSAHWVELSSKSQQQIINLQNRALTGNADDILAYMAFCERVCKILNK